MGITISVPPGTHTLRFSAANYVPVDGELQSRRRSYFEASTLDE
jgi:hypothetical protein